jgi:hypothetical protein
LAFSAAVIAWKIGHEEPRDGSPAVRAARTLVLAFVVSFAVLVAATLPLEFVSPRYGRPSDLIRMVAPGLIFFGVLAVVLLTPLAWPTRTPENVADVELARAQARNRRTIVFIVVLLAVVFVLAMSVAVVFPQPTTGGPG